MPTKSPRPSTRKAGKAGSGRKGKSFERDIAGRIRDAFKTTGDPAFADLEERHLFRTPQSGGGYDKGDITKRHAELSIAFPWTVECKCNEGFPLLEQLMQNRNHRLFQKSWEQVCDEAAYNKEYPLLVWKLNLLPAMCAYPRANAMNVLDANLSETALASFWYASDLTIILFDDFVSAAVHAGLRYLRAYQGSELKDQYIFDFYSSGPSALCLPGFIKK